MRTLRIQLALMFLFTGMALSGFSRRTKAGVLGSRFAKAVFAEPAKVYLALCTVIPTDSSTGVTITEPTWTGYARKEIPAASMGSPVEAATSSIKTALELLFAECTAGSGTIIGWATTDNAATGAGNVEMWGTATSTSIAAGQTPKIAAGALEGTLA